MNTAHFTLTAVTAQPSSLLVLAYADGAVLQVNLMEIIRKHPALRPLDRPEVFAQARLGERGRSVVWPGGEDLELAADNLRARAIEQAGGYSHETVWNWMARNGLGLEAAAEALGISRRMLAYYRSGQKPVPRTVGLACTGWEAERRAA